MPQEGENTPQGGQEPAPATEPEAGQEPQGEQPQTFSRDYVEQLRQEAAGHRTKRSELEAELQEYRERDQTETEKLTNKVGSLTDENKGLKGENLRLRVAIEKKLPIDLIDRLRGATEEQLTADADTLLSLVKPEETTPDFDGGAREPAPEPKTPEQGHNDFLLKVFGAPPS